MTCFFQDNVFVQLLCSIQYRIVRQNADDAFYELQNPKEQIQAYVFDGIFNCILKVVIVLCTSSFLTFSNCAYCLSS